MPPFTFYAAFLGTFLSVTLLTSLAYKEHNPELPRTLSQLAAQNRRLVNYFRVVSAVCATLFAVTMYLFIVPDVRYTTALFIVWSIYYFSELLLAIFPARGTIEGQLHIFFAYTMALAMVATSGIFILNFTGGVRTAEIVIAFVMLILAALTRLDKRRFIFYELPFIYLSHLSILVAALALR